MIYLSPGFVNNSTMLFEPDYKIFVDGASRGNPGNAAYGFVVLDEKGHVRHEQSEYIGKTTNNVAEYTALIRALEYCLKNRILNIEIRSDSELLVKQLRGEYKVRAEHIRELFEQCRLLLAQLQWHDLKHIPREQNRLADRLANQALNRREKAVRQQIP